MNNPTILSSCACALLSTILSKAYLITSLHELDRWRFWLRAPVLVIPDAVLIMAVSYGLLGAYSHFKERQKPIAKITIKCLAVLLYIMIAVINSTCVSYYQVSSAFFKWTTAFEFMTSMQGMSELTSANSGPGLFYMFLHMMAMLCVLYCMKRRFDSDDYTSLGDSIPVAKDTVDQRNWPVWVGSMIITVYCIWAYFTCPKVGNWPLLCEPQLVSFLNAGYDAVSKRPPQPMMMIHVGWDEYDFCETINSVYEVFSKARKSCTELPPPNFSFTKRTKKHRIKNVIWLYLESARNDILPFNNQSAWVRENLNDKIRAENPISPYFTHLINQGLYFEDVRTISTYTLKSLLGGFCSVVPLPMNMLSEWNQEPYRKCLPRILQEHGWSTLHMQPASSSWDHQRENMGKIGFETMVGFQEMDRGIVVGRHKSRFQSVNYFGRDDMPMVEPLLEWVQNNRHKEKPSLITILTSVNHDPHRGPREWPMYEFLRKSEPKINRYLNTARYTDAFIHKLLTELDKGGVLEETLLVIAGDHGIALGEHHRVGTNENPAEPLVKVPLFFYSKNKEWLEKHKPRRFSQPVSSLDILPTILDFLNEDPLTPASIFTDHYEGKSLLRGCKDSRLLLTTINPGADSIVYYRDGKKVVTKSKNNAVFYDLKKDPNENAPKSGDELKDDDKEFFTHIVEFRDNFIQKSGQFWGMTVR